MAEKPRDDGLISELPEQQSTTTVTTRLSMEREKVRLERNNHEPPSISKWNSNRSGTSESFNNFSNNNNAENSSPSRNRGFGSRSGRGRGGRFGSGTDGDSRTCYNCQKTGHISRYCPESRKESRGDDDRNVIFTSTTKGGSPSMLITIHNSTNQNADDEKNNSATELNFNTRRGRAATRATNRNGTEDSRRCMIFYNSTMRGGFNNGSRFQGGRGERGFHSDNCDNRGVGSSNNSAPYNQRYIPPPPPSSAVDLFDRAIPKGENFEKTHQTQVHCLPEGIIKPIKSFQEANLDTQVLSNIRHAYFEEPTPIQCYTIPCIRQQDDIMACAQTGSGKTAAFLLPIISNLLEYHSDELSQKHQPPSPLCLILSPTRELALQTEHEARKFAYQTAVIPCSAVGGHDINTVSNRLREGCHILSATTGRLKNMVEKGQISLKKVKYFVLDEADRMLDIGFEPDIRKLQDLGLPPKDERFTFMFSATFPDEVQNLAKHFLRDNYTRLTVGTPDGANEDIAQTIEGAGQEVPEFLKKYGNESYVTNFSNTAEEKEDEEEWEDDEDA